MKNIFLLLIPFLCFSEFKQNDLPNRYQKNYVRVVKQFYIFLYNGKETNKKFSDVYWEATLNTQMLKELKPYMNELTNGLSQNEIFKIIDEAQISDEGLKFGIYVELSFPNGKNLYFELGSKDMPVIIQNIWLSDGTLLDSKVHKESNAEELLLVGMINDNDGFTNVRYKPSTSSKVVAKISNNKYLYYVPNSDREWWAVAMKDDIKAIIGYVHKSRIIKYSDMPREIKRKVIKERDSD